MMSTPDIHSINHVGMAVRNIEATADRYEALGFLLTPYSPHSGASRPGEPVTRMGSGNRCVMFSNNYLEILANEDPAHPSPRLASMLRHHQGGHIVCFGTEDVSAVDRRLVHGGFKTSGVIPLQRDIDTPDGARTAKFERVLFSPDASPEGVIQAARHLTPQYIYQPRYIAHPNGCTEVSSAVIVVDDMQGYSERYRQYTGIASESTADGAACFRFSLCSRLLLMDSAAAARYLPGSLHPPVPGIAAIGFRCPEMARQVARLNASGIPFMEAGSRLIVPAEEASGIAVVFEA